MADEDQNDKALFDALKYGNAQFDKQLLFIASGALSISFAFIEKIINLNDACHKSLLINAWFLFAGTIVLNLISQFISTQAQTWAIKYRDDAPEWKENIWNYSLRSLNFGMIILLLWGLYDLMQFIKINI